MRKFFRVANNEKGVATLIAITSLVLLLVLATEIGYDANVEYITATNNVNRLKAYYAAKGGMELSLLRILIYKKAMAAFGEQLGANKKMLDTIWSFPMSWPISEFLPDTISSVDRDMFKSAEKESIFKGRFVSTVESEESKIDINDLGSPSEPLRDAVKAQILSILTQEAENNDEFRNKYQGFDFESFVNNIIDWVDENNESLNGGDEKSQYRDFFKGEFIPPNQPFKTLEELHMVDKMNDDFFELLKPRVTIFGVKGVNVNQANNDVLKSIIVGITDEQLAQLRERLSKPDKGGPFANEEEFVQFVGGLGINNSSINPSKVPLLFDATYNFRIKVVSEFAKSVRELVAVTFDFETAKERLVSQLDKDDKDKNAGGNPPAGQPPPGGNPPGFKDENGNGIDDAQETDPNKKEEKTKKQIPQGRPNVVYWMEN